MSKTKFTVNRDERKIVMERVFAAPRELVWKMITNPQFIPRWWGPERYTTTVEKMDVQVGGGWRFIQHGPDGDEYAFSGIYKEIEPLQRLVQTFNFEPIGPGHETTETAVLEETAEGYTKMTMTSVAKTLEDFDGYVNSGMESGALETWERLATLLTTVEHV